MAVQEAAQKVGDTIVARRDDGHYDILRVGATMRVHLRDDVATLDEARTIAHETRDDEGQVWYRDHGDPPDYLERVTACIERRGEPPEEDGDTRPAA